MFPKIETVFDRDPKTFKVTERLRRPEFQMLHPWHITEKIDGTNIRVELTAGEGSSWGYPERSLRVLGRTDKAQTPVFLSSAVQELFPPMEDVWNVFHADDLANEEPYTVVMYGEGYGPRIQKGGGNYRDTPGFRLFDVRVGRKWLDWPNVEDVAEQLGIQTVPVLDDNTSIEEAAGLARGFDSIAAKQDGGAGLAAEGIVARTVPYLYDWRGDRVMWKLKTKDLP